MTGSRGAMPGKLSFFLRIAVPLAVLVFVAGDATVRSRHILRVSAGYGVTVDPPAPDANSPTGYAGGVRSIVLPEAGEDTAHWVMQTQTMIAHGEWRIRTVDYDNAPAGRDVHWAALFHWWLALLAWIDHLVTGQPLGIAVERAALTSGPVMFGLMLLGLVPLLNRRFSATASALVAIGAVTTSSFYTDFLPGRADHHGLVNLCGLLMVLFLVVGSEDPANDDAPSPTPTRPRRWFIASAVAGGVGLWVSAATMIPVLFGLGLGILTAGWLGRDGGGRASWLRDPGLFRLWGFVGGGVSLATYLIEYFPSHFSMRLEVNHPLYAAAWIGGAELLHLGVRIVGRLRPLQRRDFTTGAVALVLVALPPLAILALSAKAFLLLDPFLWALHKFYITEEQNLLHALTTKGSVVQNLANLCLPCLLLVPPLVLAFRTSTTRETKMLLALTLFPAVISWIQCWNQVRWLSLAYALTVPAVAVFFRAIESRRPARRGPVLAWAGACALLFVPGALKAARQTLAGADFTNQEIRNLAQRDVAHWLRQRVGPGRPLVVAGSPTTTTLMISLAGASGLGTLYWENVEGLKHAAELFAAPSSEEAEALVRRLGVTHIVFFTWDPFEVALAKLARGLPSDAPIPQDSFVVKLLGARIPPPWLRALPFSLPEHTALAGEQIRLWEVTPDQTPAEAAAHAANYYLETGKPDPGGQIAAALAGFPRDLSANVMLAGLESRQQDSAAFSTALRRILDQLPQAGALSLEDQIHLTVVLAVAQQFELAQAQLRACMAKVDEPGLRHLTPGTLSDLLSLSDGLHVALPSPALQQLARQLVPPLQRK
jgi:hypothetical protein